MFDGKSRLKPEDIQYSNLETVKEFIKERLGSLQKYADEQPKEPSEGFLIFKREYGVCRVLEVLYKTIR